MKLKEVIKALASIATFAVDSPNISLAVSKFLSDKSENSSKFEPPLQFSSEDELLGESRSKEQGSSVASPLSHFDAPIAIAIDSEIDLYSTIISTLKKSRHSKVLETKEEDLRASSENVRPPAIDDPSRKTPTPLDYTAPLDLAPKQH